MLSTLVAVKCMRVNRILDTKSSKVIDWLNVKFYDCIAVNILLSLVQGDEGDKAEHQRRLRICHEDEEDRAGEGQGQEAEAGAGGQGRRSARG